MQLIEDEINASARFCGVESIPALYQFFKFN